MEEMEEMEDFIKFEVTAKQQYKESYQLNLTSMGKQNHRQEIYVVLDRDTWLRARIGDMVKLNLSFQLPE